MGSACFCIGEFLRVVTHPKLFDPPSTIAESTAAIDGLLQSPSLITLSPGDNFWPMLTAIVQKADARGNLIYDAQIVAVCQEYGVRELLSHDRDFKRFEGIVLHTL